jgi:hypothetical protein
MPASSVVDDHVMVSVADGSVIFIMLASSEVDDHVMVSKRRTICSITDFVLQL